MEILIKRIEELLERMKNVEMTVAQLVELRTVKDWYTTDEVAKILGKHPFTVREWCRLGRVHCEKKQSGRGKFTAWVISHAEILRIQRDGLLPQHSGVDLSMFDRRAVGSPGTELEFAL